MHAKTLIMDGKVVLTGSMNMTHNRYENNKEHMYRITEPATVSDVQADFEKGWDEAELVTMITMNAMLENFEKQKRTRDARNRKHGRSPSKGRARSLSRSLSTEFEEAAPSQALASNGESSGAVVS